MRDSSQAIKNEIAQKIIDGCNHPPCLGDGECTDDGVYCEKDIINGQEVLIFGVAGDTLIVPVSDFCR